MLSQRPDHKDGIDNDNDGVTLLTPEHITCLHVNAAIVMPTNGDAIVDTLCKKGLAPVNPNDRDAVWMMEDGLTL